MFLGGWSDSTACVIFFSKYPWCTVLLQPLCLQPQHLPQVFPLQPQQPIRFAFLLRPPPPSPALTFFFPLASYDSHVLYKKMHEWCTGLIPDLCQLLTAFFIQEIIAWLFIYLRSLECCLSLPPLKCLFFFFYFYPRHWLLPPSGFSLSHRFQLYLQTTWLVTSMLRRCRTLTLLNGMCPLVVSPSTVHKLLLFQWLEIAWRQR